MVSYIMNTFLPYDNIEQSADCIDKKRAFKQTLETSQILSALAGKSKGWVNHPATRMWKGYEASLICYYNIFWTVCKEKWNVNFNKLQKMDNPIGLSAVYPPWFGYPKFHSLMRANLLRKNSEWYGKYGWDEVPAEGYYWPVDKNGLLEQEVWDWRKHEAGL